MSNKASASGRVVLVTGGAGYIGSHACKALARSGYSPVSYDNLVYGHDWAAKWGPLEVGDILDKERLSQVIKTHNPASVMHFAAFAYVGESTTDPGRYYRNNVLGTLSLLDVMRSHGLEKIVFSSSCATYGIPDSVPIRENAPQRPISPYGSTKLMAERIIADYGSAYGLKSIALRYFNAAGADPDGELGEEHEPETHLLPLVLQTAAGKMDEITIFGDNYATPDGTCIRDYVHVSDIAEAHVLALKKLEGTPSRLAYNLGTGSGVSVKQLIDAARSVTGRGIKMAVGPRREGDPAALLADPKLAHDELGWTPKLPRIDDMIQTAWNWTSKHRPSHRVSAQR